MLAVDANVILSVVLGRRSRPIFERVVAHRTVVTSARAAAEVRGVLQDKPNLPGDAVELADALLAGILVADEAIYAELLDAAAQVLARAVPSRDASTRDAHLRACAWVFDADLWSHDRDCAGTGWPSWSNGNLSDSLDSSPM